MSETNKQRRFSPDKSQSDCSMQWICVSFVISGCVLVWAFTMPMRTQSTPPPAIEAKDVKVEYGIAERIEQRRREARTYREAAIQMDQDFMRTVKEKNKKSTVAKPGLKRSRERWEQHVNLVRRQAKALSTAPEGSVEWKYRQELLESVSDAPR